MAVIYIMLRQQELLPMRIKQGSLFLWHSKSHSNKTVSTPAPKPPPPPPPPPIHPFHYRRGHTHHWVTAHCYVLLRYYWVESERVSLVVCQWPGWQWFTANDPPTPPTNPVHLSVCLCLNRNMSVSKGSCAFRVRMHKCSEAPVLSEIKIRPPKLLPHPPCHHSAHNSVSGRSHQAELRVMHAPLLSLYRCAVPFHFSSTPCNYCLQLRQPPDRESSHHHLPSFPIHDKFPRLHCCFHLISCLLFLLFFHLYR